MVCGNQRRKEKEEEGDEKKVRELKQERNFKVGRAENMQGNARERERQAGRLVDENGKPK